MRKIIHIDMDCFYAAIEQRDDLHLKDMPIAVGGQPHSRGVVATCNYQARQYGVHSAMSSAHAAKLCPELIFVKPNMEKYRQESNKIRSIFNQYSDFVEPLSLDEAYLDTSESTRCQGSATWIAQAICKQIYETTQLTASAGVATSKFLAKIASDWNKPAGIKVILPEEEIEFINQLAVRKLHGVGKVTAAKLEAMDIFNCLELRQLDLNLLIKRFGKTGKYLYELCRGIDLRSVNNNSTRKSISVETTFNEDVSDLKECQNELLKLVSSLSSRIERFDKEAKIHKVYVKIKLTNFELHTAESISLGLDVKLLFALLERLRKQHPKPIRLLGIGVRLANSGVSPIAKQLDIPF